MAEEKKEKGTFIQLVFFILMSLVAFALQMVIVQFGDDLLELCGVDGTTKFTAWIFGEYTMTTFIAFLVGNVVAKVVSYILNRKKTFAATNNFAFSFSIYIVMCVVLIIAETLIGEPLGNAYAKVLPESLKDWGATCSMITYSIADFVIVFLMEKFFIMNNNLFKNKKTAVETADNTEIVEEVTPVTETTEEVELEAEDEKKNNKIEKEEQPVVEEPKSEEKAIEETPVVEEKKVEEAAPVVVETKEEVVEEQQKEIKEEPIQESKLEEASLVEEKSTAAKKTVKSTGKIEFALKVDGYHFYILANNGQLMFESQGFASIDSAKSAFDVFKKALATGVASVYEDKNGQFRFIINKRYNGEGYATKAQADKAITSVRKFAEQGTVVDYVEDPVAEKNYEEAKKNFNNGKGVNWDEALAIPAKSSGKFTITGHANRGFFFTLYANNGQLLFTSRYYASEDSCETAIVTFKKAAYLGNFFIDSDKFGNFRYVLKSGNGIVYNGESYGTKDSAQSSAESVKKFARSAKIMPFVEEND